MDTQENQTPDTSSLDPRDASRLSKFLALVLRHRATQFGLPLDDEGFVPLADLLELIHHETGLTFIDAAAIASLTGSHKRQRFEIQGDKVRATYGHSFSSPIHYPAFDPPEVLYVGMGKGAATRAKALGVTPEGRQYVHLTDDLEEAMEVGRRRGEEPDVVVIRAQDAVADGFVFHRPTEGLFLSGPIPPKYIDAPQQFGRRARRGRRR
jgi:putative RNA 2'-phosphotransferase